MERKCKEGLMEQDKDRERTLPITIMGETELTWGNKLITNQIRIG